MPKFPWLLTLLLLLPSGGAVAAQHDDPEQPADPGRTVLPASPLEIAMDLNTGRPMVDVLVDGSGPYRFVVDTGAQFSLIDAGIASDLGLEVVGSQMVRSPGVSENIVARRVRPARVEVGGLALEQPVLAAMDLVGVSAGAIEGIIGLGHFRDLLLTFDYPRSRLVVAKGKLDRDDPATVQLDPDREHVQIPADIGGVSMPIVIDTGSPGGFTVPKAFEPRLRFRSEPTPGPTIHLVGGAHPTWRGQLEGTIRVADIGYENPQVALTTIVEDFGHIGFLVLRELVITLDQASRLVRLERVAAPQIAQVPVRVRATGSGPVALPGAKPRLGVAFRMSPRGFAKESGGLVVQHVDSGGAADQAGLQSGDIVLAVNGTPLANIEKAAEIGALLRGQRPLELSVLRGGQRVAVVIP